MHRRTRRSAFILATLVLVAVGAGAQPAPAPDGGPDTWITHLFPVQHADVRDLADVLRMFPGIVNPQVDLGVIAWKGPEAALPAVEAAIASLDVPPAPAPNVELTAYLILASKGGRGGSPPAALADVAEQLEAVFGFDSLRLVETAVIRARDGSGGQVEGVLPELSGEGRPTRFRVGFKRLRVTGDDGGRSIRVDRFAATVLTPHTVVEQGQPSTQHLSVGIDTDIDLREGQKAVIGKTSLEGTAETLFVVITGRVDG
jgi:hypothetical protein